ncbi:MAG: hypothetical protein RLZZ68_736, partial [Bacteroidota bacterium]
MDGRQSRGIGEKKSNILVFNIFSIFEALTSGKSKTVKSRQLIKPNYYVRSRKTRPVQDD